MIVDGGQYVFLPLLICLAENIVRYVFNMGFKVQIHYERLHLKLKNFLCQHCPKGYYSKIEYEEHLNGVHLNIKPYTCDLCGYASAYNRKLQEHHKVVHGNQKYDCPMCNYSAKYDSNLTKHIQKVHKNTFKEQPAM